MKITELSLKNVQKTFKQGDLSVNVLHQVTANFQQGFSYAIMGVSGSGKSTLLHLLAGLDLPTHGHIFINGVDMTLLKPTDREQILHKTIGLVFQLPYLIKELSVIENVMLKGLIDGQSLTTCRTQALQILDMVGLAEKADEQPAMLSGGQQQRVALARAIFNKPAFLIADEPTGNLDETTGNEILRLLLLCQVEWKMGVVVSTHNKNVADAMDQVLSLHDGHLTENSF